MGLNCTHGCFDGPYSYFNSFREWIANQIGVNLNVMEGFGISSGLPWDNVDHPIKPLLDHSDCDGELTPEQCDSIVKGGQMILDSIPGDWGEFAIRLQLFINGCRDAYEKGESVQFR